MTQQLAITPRPATLAVPAAVAELGDDAARAFIDFFTARIRNKHTRAAYGRAAGGFLGWIEERGIGLRQVETFHVSAYVEELTAARSAATVKQHLAALRMLGKFLVSRRVLDRSPAEDVQGPRHVVRVGKTPVMSGTDCRRLLDSIDTSSPSGVRDRALIGLMVFTFGRVSAVLNLSAGDVYQVGYGLRVMFREKGGRDHEMPLHHTAVEYLTAYAEAAGIELGNKQGGSLFRSIQRTRDGFTDRPMARQHALEMVKRRCRDAGLGDRFTNHSFRAAGITAYLKNGGQLEHAQLMAGHAKPETTKLYDRRSQETTLDEVEKIVL